MNYLKKIPIVLGLIFYSFVHFAADALAESPDAPTKRSQRVLVYKGPGACVDGCAEAAYELALKFGFAPEYVGPDAVKNNDDPKVAASLFKDVAFWMQPGGKSRVVVSSMSLTLKNALRAFVENGGGYVGFCAGAFASTPVVGTTRYRGYGILPGRTQLFKHKKNIDYLPVNWGGKTRHLYFEGGPFLHSIIDGQVEVTARYGNGAIASAKSHFGKGRVYVTGLHPEAPLSWGQDVQLVDPDGRDDDLVKEMMDWVTESR